MGTLTNPTVGVSLSGTFSSADDLTTVSQSIGISVQQSWTNGTDSNQANQFYSDQITASASAESIDLAGSLTDVFGSTITFTKVRGLYVRNRATTTAFDLTIAGNFMTTSVIGGSSQNLVLEPGGVLLLTAPVDGYVVTAATADVISFDPGANTVTFDVAIYGTV